VESVEKQWEMMGSEQRRLDERASWRRIGYLRLRIGAIQSNWGCE
jgi:hypothetical protein